jgi:hypothetical protein
LPSFKRSMSTSPKSPYLSGHRASALTSHLAHLVFPADSELRISYGSMMKRIVFPRDRKRDSLFGGMRKKALQELKEQQLALYVENVRSESINQS